MAKSKYEIERNFLSGIGAAHNMLADAVEAKMAPIEQICLSATLIDGLLRLSLVMKRQLATGKHITDSALLYQGKLQKTFISERKIYEKARKEKIITAQIEKKLQALYNQRNIIVHRYLISNIKTIQVALIAKRYLHIYSEIKERHRIIHNQLVAGNIGMAKRFIRNPSKMQIQEQMAQKHFK